MLKRTGKSAAQRVREYRARKKLLKESQMSADTTPKHVKSSTERSREWRERQRMLRTSDSCNQQSKQVNSSAPRPQVKKERRKNLAEPSVAEECEQRKTGNSVAMTPGPKTFVLSVETCVCCLGNQAEELLWARRDDGGSYGGIVKALFGIQFPVPDVLSMSTRICNLCIEQVERTLQLRTRLLTSQTRLPHARWLLPTGHQMATPSQLLVEGPDYCLPNPPSLLHTEGTQDSIEICVETIKTEDDIEIEEHEPGYSNAASSSASLPLAAALPTANGSWVTTGRQSNKVEVKAEPPDEAVQMIEIKLEPSDVMLEHSDVE